MCARRDVHPREGSYASSIIECEGASTGLGKMLCPRLGFNVQYDGLPFVRRKHCTQLVAVNGGFAAIGESTRKLREFIDCHRARSSSSRALLSAGRAAAHVGFELLPNDCGIAGITPAYDAVQHWQASPLGASAGMSYRDTRSGYQRTGAMRWHHRDVVLKNACHLRCASCNLAVCESVSRARSRPWRSPAITLRSRRSMPSGLTRVFGRVAASHAGA